MTHKIIPFLSLPFLSIVCFANTIQIDPQKFACEQIFNSSLSFDVEKLGNLTNRVYMDSKGFFINDWKKQIKSQREGLHIDTFPELPPFKLIARNGRYLLLETRTPFEEVSLYDDHSQTYIARFAAEDPSQGVQVSFLGKNQLIVKNGLHLALFSLKEKSLHRSHKIELSKKVFEPFIHDSELLSAFIGTNFIENIASSHFDQRIIHFAKAINADSSLSPFVLQTMGGLIRPLYFLPSAKKTIVHTWGENIKVSYSDLKIHEHDGHLFVYQLVGNKKSRDQHSSLILQWNVTKREFVRGIEIIGIVRNFEVSPSGEKLAIYVTQLPENKDQTEHNSITFVDLNSEKTNQSPIMNQLSLPSTREEKWGALYMSFSQENILNISRAHPPYKIGRIIIQKEKPPEF
ncbi:MAG: hypothetical protein CL678_04995 [Bdellovibrionaceae bacterium]|nr:hypothetical protein [Pseudobdellovibrionaceae bacterium]|tara:strand:- start:2997 stop:4205 length:1209 start_codon:yes stop_codon:yes gene_type:complete